MTQKSITEQSSYYDNLEHMSISDLLQNMNKEDMKVPQAVAGVIPQIEPLVSETVKRFERS